MGQNKPNNEKNKENQKKSQHLALQIWLELNCNEMKTFSY